MTIVEEIDKKSERPHRSKNITDALKYLFELDKTPQNISEAVKGYSGGGGVDEGLVMFDGNITGLIESKGVFSISPDELQNNEINEHDLICIEVANDYVNGKLYYHVSGTSLQEEENDVTKNALSNNGIPFIIMTLKGRKKVYSDSTWYITQLKCGRMYPESDEDSIHIKITLTSHGSK